MSNKLRPYQYLPSMTNIATVIYENESQPDARQTAKHQDKIAEQLQGVEALQGTHPFTLESAHSCWRLNDFLHRLIVPEHRKRFVNEPDALFAEYQLTVYEMELIQNRDWIGLIHYGVIFFSLEKMAAVLGMSNMDIYAQMRGQTVEEFQKSRNAAISYSVAGKED